MGRRCFLPGLLNCAQRARYRGRQDDEARRRRYRGWCHAGGESGEDARHRSSSGARRRHLRGDAIQPIPSMSPSLLFCFPPFVHLRSHAPSPLLRHLCVLNMFGTARHRILIDQLGMPSAGVHMTIAQEPGHVHRSGQASGTVGPIFARATRRKCNILGA